MGKILIGNLAAILFFGVAVIGASAAIDGWETNGADIYTQNVNNAKVGIGVSQPNARLHIKNILHDSGTPAPLRTAGLLLELPSIITSGGNPGPAIQWQTQNDQSTAWRQYFNSGENGWALAYNAMWDYAAKKWLPSNGFSALMRFDVSKGDTGQNAFEIGFARSGDANGPKWAEGARYKFYDGGGPSNLPARLLVEGGELKDAMVSLRSGDYTDISLVADKDNFFKIENTRDYFGGTSGRELLVINTNTGNVGIGTTNPTHKLSVIGTAGLSTGTAWTQISDARYKDIQSELKGGALEKIMNLHPVSYEWNSLYQDKYGKKDGLNYGFVAQEVQKVIPEFVSQDKEGYLWYNPSGFEAILTAAVQEQEKELADLKAELEDIKTKLNLVR